MRTQFRHSYEVDNRYKNVRKGVDDNKGQQFLKSYIGRLRDKGFPRPKLT